MQDAAILPSEVAPKKSQKKAFPAPARQKKPNGKKPKHSFQTPRLPRSCSYVKKAGGALQRGGPPAAENDQRKHAVIAACRF